MDAQSIDEVERAAVGHLLEEGEHPDPAPAASPPEINFACEPVEARARCAACSRATNGSTLGCGRAKYSLFGSFQISHAWICGYRSSAAEKNRSKAVMSVG